MTPESRTGHMADWLPVADAPPHIAGLFRSLAIMQGCAERAHTRAKDAGEDMSAWRQYHLAYAEHEACRCRLVIACLPFADSRLRVDGKLLRVSRGGRDDDYRSRVSWEDE